MAGMFDELWPLFVAEVTEQLDALEHELDGRAPADIRVDALFRLFHTIKSSCAMLEFKSMEEIAHTSEDVLDLARRGERQVSAEMLQVFIEAVDTLKDQLAEVSRSKSNPQPRQELVSRIRQFVEAGSQPAAPGVSMPAAWDARELEQLNILLKDNLHRSVCPFVTGDSAAAKQSLVRMRNFFDLMEKPEWSGSMRRLLVYIADDALFEQPASRRIVADCLDILQAALPAGTGMDAVFACRKAYRDHLAGERQRILKSIATDILPVFATDALTPVYPPDADRHLASILLDARLSGETTLADLVYALKHLLKYRVYEAGHVQLDLAACASALQACDHRPEMLAQLIATLHDALPRQDAADQRQSPVYVEWSSQSITRTLWDKQVERNPCPQADELYDKGGYLFEIYADLETDRNFATQFTNWLYTNAQVFTNAHVSELHAAGVVIRPTLVFLAGVPTRDMANLFSEGLNRHSGFVEYRKIAKSLVQSREQKADGEISAASVRVSSETLEQFVSRIGEMVTLRNALMHEIDSPELVDALARIEKLLNSGQSDASLAGIKPALVAMESFYHRLRSTSEKLDKAINHIQEDVISLRVVPVGLVLGRLPKLVRKLSRDLGKNVSLILRGEEVRVDKSLVDFLMEPLTHLVRNALDHGIEPEAERLAHGKPAQARLSITASHVGNSMCIEVRDDGRGLQKEKILRKAVERGIDVETDATDADIYRLIFHPGFSTAEVVTETSGRGVGMDAVKSRIEAIGGSVAVESTPGQGVIFTLSLPLSVAVQGILVFGINSQPYAISERDVVEVLEVPVEGLFSRDGQCYFSLREQEIPLYRLGHLVGFSTNTRLPVNIPVILVRSAHRMAGFAAEVIHGRQDTYLQDVDDYLFRLPAFAGAGILGDGAVVVVLDAHGLIEMASQYRHAPGIFQSDDHPVTESV